MSETTTVALTVRMPKALHTEMVRLAKRELSSVNRELLIASRAHIDASKKRRTR